jgi:hypothetical protein
MSSSSVNSEKIDYDTYTINNHYEKINSSVVCDENQMAFSHQCSQSLLTSTIATSDQGEPTLLLPSLIFRTISLSLSLSSPICGRTFSSLRQYHSKQWRVKDM